MIRFTLDERTMQIAVHGCMGERPPLPDETDLIREALEPKPLPLWLDLSVVAVAIGAMAWLGHGINKGIGS